MINARINNTFGVLGLEALRDGLEPLTTAVGLLLVLAGVTAIVLTVAHWWMREMAASDASRLVPTLLEDVLEDDLGALYERSLSLDARVAARPCQLASPTGTALGRRARRALVEVQARRFSTDQSRRGEPPIGETRLAQIEKVLDAALEASASEDLDAEALAGRLSELESALVDLEVHQ